MLGHVMLGILKLKINQLSPSNTFQDLPVTKGEYHENL
jgi:hypothetical protein